MKRRISTKGVAKSAYHSGKNAATFTGLTVWGATASMAGPVAYHTRKAVKAQRAGRHYSYTNTTSLNRHLARGAIGAGTTMTTVYGVKKYRQRRKKVK